MVHHQGRQVGEVEVVCDISQWNPLVAASPCPWGESILSPDVRCSINLVLKESS